MKKQLTARHLILCLVAHVDQHRHQSTRVIEVDRTVVSHLTLMDVHTDPQLIRLVFNLAEGGALFIDAVLAIGNIARFG
jgi:hypothetical protein